MVAEVCGCGRGGAERLGSGKGAVSPVGWHGCTPRDIPSVVGQRLSKDIQSLDATRRPFSSPTPRCGRPSRASPAVSRSNRSSIDFGRPADAVVALRGSGTMSGTPVAAASGALHDDSEVDVAIPTADAGTSRARSARHPGQARAGGSTGRSPDRSAGRERRSASRGPCRRRAVVRSQRRTIARARDQYPSRVPRRRLPRTSNRRGAAPTTGARARLRRTFSDAGPSRCCITARGSRLARASAAARWPFHARSRLVVMRGSRPRVVQPVTSACHRSRFREPPATADG